MFPTRLIGRGVRPEWSWGAPGFGIHLSRGGMAVWGDIFQIFRKTWEYFGKLWEGGGGMGVRGNISKYMGKLWNTGENLGWGFGVIFHHI